MGVSLSGAPFLNSINKNKVDPIVPAPYKGASNPVTEAAKLDSCMGTVMQDDTAQLQNWGIYGYMVPSYCLIKDSFNNYADAKAIYDFDYVTETGMSIELNK